MANERTFLTWIRTAAFFVSFGIGILQFYRLQKISIELQADGLNDSDTKYNNVTVKSILRVLAILFIALSFISAAFGAFRYFQVQGTLLHNYYPVTRLLILVIMALNFALIAILLVMDIKVTI